MVQNKSEIVRTCQNKCNLSEKHCRFSRVWQNLVGFSGVWFFDAPLVVKKSYPVISDIQLLQRVESEELRRIRRKMWKPLVRRRVVVHIPGTHHLPVCFVSKQRRTTTVIKEVNSDEQQQRTSFEQGPPLQVHRYIYIYIYIINTRALINLFAMLRKACL